MRFWARTRRFPKLLVSDQAGGIFPKVKGERIAAQGMHINPVSKDKHSKIDSAVRAIDNIDRMVATLLLDSNIPKSYWDVIGEHCHAALYLIL